MMNNRVCVSPFQAFVFILITCLAFSVDPCGAKPTALDDLLLDIQNKSEEITSLRCDFTQTKILSLFNKPIVFQGQLSLIRPDKLRWEFTSPIPSVLIFNGENGIRCTDNKAATTFSLTSDPVMRMVATQLWTWLNGDYTQLKDDYLIEKTNVSSITITPKKETTAQYIEAITITFEETTKQVMKVSISEPGGDITHIVFTNYLLNPKLPESTFSHCNRLE